MSENIPEIKQESVEVSQHGKPMRDTKIKPTRRFASIEDTLYQDIQEEDSAQRTIRQLIADTTLPLSIRKTLEDKNRALTKQLNVDETRAPTIIEERTQAELENLVTTPSMTRLRAEAKDLLERYEKIGIKGYGTADAYFMRNATALHERMLKFADEYFKYKDGVIAVSPFELPTKAIMGQIQADIEHIKSMREETRDIDEYTGSDTNKITVGFALKERGNVGWTDRDEVELKIDEDGKIISFVINEYTDPRTYCVKLSDYAEAYNRGESISPLVKKLLIDQGYVKRDAPSDETSDLPVTFYYDDSLTENSLITPTGLFPYSIPPELAEKISRSGRPFRSGSGGAVMAHHSLLTYYNHDYGNIQSILNFHTEGIPNEQVLDLIGGYVELLKNFSQIKKPATD